VAEIFLIKDFSASDIVANRLYIRWSPIKPPAPEVHHFFLANTQANLEVYYGGACPKLCYTAFILPPPNHSAHTK